MFRFFPEYKFRRSTWYKFVRDQVAKNVGRIQYNSPVVEIDYSNKQVQLTTANGECFVADKVIMTTSVGVLRSGDIKFVPALSARRQAALKAVQFLPGFKLLLKFLETFYPDAINCGLNQGDDGEKVFYDIAFEKGAQTNVLGFLATGTATEPYCETPIFFPRVQNLRTLPHNVMCRRHGIPFSNCKSCAQRARQNLRLSCKPHLQR